MLLDAVRHLTSSLTSRGFTKYGKRHPAYHRTRDERVEILDIQGDKWHRESFTVNVAVFWPALDPLVSPHPVGSGRPEEYQCPLRARLAQLGPDGRPQPANPDRWWDATAGAEAVAREVLKEIETRAFPFFDRIANRPALLEAIRTGEVRTGALWAAAIAAWAGDTAYADRILAEHLARLTPGRVHALTRRRMAIIAAGLGLAQPGPDQLGEEMVTVRLTCASGSTRDQSDQVYTTLHTGLWRVLPEDGPDYVLEISGIPDGHTTAILYGPDAAALTRRIRPLLDEVAALPARPQWTVTPDVPSGGSR